MKFIIIALGLCTYEWKYSTKNIRILMDYGTVFSILFKEMSVNDNQ